MTNVSVTRMVQRVIAAQPDVWPDDNQIVVGVWLQVQPEAAYDLVSVHRCLPSAASILRVAARLRAAERQRVAA